MKKVLLIGDAAFQGYPPNVVKELEGECFSKVDCRMNKEGWRICRQV